jgi:L-lysine 6-transaminase
MDASRVHETLSGHILADGFDFVVDLNESHGSYLRDKRDGSDILDLFSCFSSLPIGWNHPALVEIEAKLGRVSVNNITNSDLYSVEMAQAVETIASIAKPSYLPHMFFIAGGALGVENCLKAAMDWKHHHREAAGLASSVDRPQLSIAHFDEAFHGRSGYTMSLTNTDPAKTDRFVKFDWPRILNPKINFPLDAGESARLDASEAAALDQLRAAADASPEQIAGVIIEPIQGEGGDNHFRDSFMRDLMRVTHEIGALFIVDEVQTGVGGTGKMWAHQHAGIEPDLLAFGKKMQVCGMMAGERLLEFDDNVFTTSSRINSTWGGNLVDYVRSAKCLEVIEAEGLVRHAEVVGGELYTGLAEMAAKHDFISGVRARGLFAAFTLPNRSLRDEFRTQALDNGVLVLNSGNDSIRLRPCLNISSNEINEALNVFDKTATTIAGKMVA